MTRTEVVAQLMSTLEFKEHHGPDQRRWIVRTPFKIYQIKEVGESFVSSIYEADGRQLGESSDLEDAKKLIANTICSLILDTLFGMPTPSGKQKPGFEMRMKLEYWQLKDRIDKLVNFIQTEKFNSLDKPLQEATKNQLVAMRSYELALSKRIELLNIEKI